MTQKKKPYLRILTPPDDLSGIMKKVRRIRYEKARKILVIAVLLLPAGCGPYLILKNQSYGKASTAAQYSADISDTSSYAQFADGIVRYNRDGVAFLNKKNEEQWMQSMQIQNPVIVVKEDSFAVADNGGNNIFVFSKDGLKGEIETTLPIEKIAVSDQGVVSVLLRNETTPTIMVYDAAGNTLAEMQGSPGTTGYPTAMEMSDDGSTLAVSYIYFEGTAEKSRVVYYNFGETGQDKTDNIVSSEEYADTIVGDIFFMGDDRSVVVGDNSLVIYQGIDAPRAEKVISLDQEIQSVFHSDEYIGLVLLNREKSGYELRLYNRLGEVMIGRDIPGKYSNARIDGDEIVMFDGSRCCIVTVTGIIKYHGNLDVEIQEMFRAFGVNRYYVMSVDELRIIYLTR